MRFEYTITGSGWAEVSIECGEQRAQFVASYLSDCLRDLARAATDLCTGSQEEAVSFLDEPGEHRLVMRRIENGRLEMKVLWYEDWVDSIPVVEPKAQLLSCTTTLAHLRGQVHSAMRRLLENLGADGYKERWVNAAFPFVEYENLGRSAA
jgi:hypothetical protein